MTTTKKLRVRTSAAVARSQTKRLEAELAKHRANALAMAEAWAAWLDNDDERWPPDAMLNAMSAVVEGYGFKVERSDETEEG